MEAPAGPALSGIKRKAVLAALALNVGELVTVELNDGQASSAVAVVERIEGAQETVVDGRHVHTRVPNGAQAIPAILGRLDSAGFPVAAVTTSRPSLDDVYLHYTGRDFASEDEEGQK